MSIEEPQYSVNRIVEVKHREIIESYLTWEERTSELCRIGRAANSLIDGWYDPRSGSENWFLDPDFQRQFCSLTTPRSRFWEDHGVSKQRVIDWIQQLQQHLDSADRAKDWLGKARAWIWGNYSTREIIRILPDVEPQLLSRFDMLLDDAKHSLISDRKGMNSVTRVHTASTSNELLSRQGIKNHLGVYLIKEDGRPKKYVEVVESWRLYLDQVTVCTPLSVGCPNLCSMCDLSTYFGGNLRPEQILHLLFLNFLNNQDIPIKDFEKKLKIYFLGGGDALAYKWLPELIDLVSDKYPAAQQIYSSIGINDRDCFNRVLERAKVLPQIGFQFSLCSLDSKLRERFARSNLPLLSAEECVSWAIDFYAATGRRSHLSVFLNHDQKLEEFIASVVNKVPRDAIHLALTTLNPGVLPNSRLGASLSFYQEAMAALSQLGYSTHICTNDLDPENTISCGVMEEVVRSGNSQYLKKSLKINPLS